jgi:hypothetical protein
MHAFRSARAATLLGGVLVAGLVLAGCGGGSSHAAGANPAPTTTTTVAGGRGALLAAFRSCMSSHGVTLPTRVRTVPNGGPPSSTPGETRPSGSSGGGGGFGFGGGGNPANRFATAPKGVDPTKYAAALAACRSTLPTGPNPANNSAFQAYRSCLQDHGVTLPTTGGAGSINRNDPKVQAALKTCQALRPARGFGRPTTTTTAPHA